MLNLGGINRSMGEVAIGGVEPCSLSDFPGTVAAVLFTQGCNFNCPYCHNRRLIPRSGGVRCREAMAPVLARKGRIQGVVVTGGEPTLQPGLISLLEYLKGEGFKVKLDTNGSRPSVLRRLLEAGLLDFVALDVKAPPGKYRAVAGHGADAEAVEHSMTLLASSGVPHLFRTTWDTSLLTQDDIEAIRRWIPSGSAYKLQECRPVAG